MRHKTLRCVLILLLTAAGCAPRPQTVKPVDPAAALAASADRLAAEQSWHQALAVYQKVLQGYPQSAAVPGVLMKMGQAYGALKAYGRAREAYRRLMREYPRSPYYETACAAVLQSYYAQKRYAELAAAAEAVLGEAASPALKAEARTLLGDAYNARGFHLKAVHQYLMAYPPASADRRGRLQAKLHEALEPLGVADVSEVLETVENPDLEALLLHALGLKQFAAGDIDAAADTMAVLSEKHASTDFAEKGRAMLEKIEREYRYQSNTLGCLLPLSGPYSAYGRRALAGIELALNRFCAQHRAAPLKILVKDTRAEAGQAARAAAEIIDARVAAIVGPIIAVEAAAASAQQAGIPIMMLTQKDQITSRGDFVFRNFMTPREQIKTLAHFAFESLGLSSFAILYPDENYGQTFMNLFWDEIIAYGGRVVGAEAYAGDQTDFADSIKKLVGRFYDIPEELMPAVEADAETTDGAATATISAGIDDDRGGDGKEPPPIVDFEAVFIPDSPAKAAMIIPQLAFYDVIGVQLIGTNLWHTPKFIEHSRPYAEGALMVDGFFPGSKNPQVRDFVARFEAIYGRTPRFIEAVAYDSAMILLEIISRPEPRTRTQIRDRLFDSGRYPGVTGDIIFDRTGEARKGLHLLQVAGGRFIELKPH